MVSYISIWLPSVAQLRDIARRTVARWVEMLASSPNVTHSAEKSLHCFASITSGLHRSGRVWAFLSEERAEGWCVVWVDPGRPPQPPMRLGVQGTPPSVPLRGGVLRLLRGARSASSGSMRDPKRISGCARAHEIHKAHSAGTRPAKVHKRAASPRQDSVSQTALRSCRLFPAVSTQYRTGGSSHAI